MAHIFMRSLAGLGFDPKWLTPAALLGTPSDITALNLMLVEISGTPDWLAQSLVDWVGQHLPLQGSATIILCEATQVDQLGPLLGTGIVSLCDAEPGEIESALRHALRLARLRTPARLESRRDAARSAPSAQIAPPWPEAEMTDHPAPPYWLDILSDLVTHLAIVHRAGGRQSDAMGDVLGQAIGDLLALPDENELEDAVRWASQGEGAAELAMLLGEFDRRRGRLQADISLN